MDQFFHCTSKKLLTLKNSKKYLSKLAYITLSHRFTDLSCECKNVVQTCPELTLFLPSVAISILVHCTMRFPMSIDILEIHKCKKSFHAHSEKYSFLF